MMTVTFSFEKSAERDRFMRHLTESLAGPSDNYSNIQKLIAGALKTAKYDALIDSDKDKVYSLWVSGQKMLEGRLAELENKFSMECDSHSASVAIKEMRNGTWVEIRKRNVQPR